MSRAGAVTAEQALRSAGLDPAEVRRVVPRVDPATTWIRPAPSWYRRLWAKGIVAVTMPWGISMDRVVLAALADPARASRWGPLVVHELVHVDQYRRLGPTRHLTRYLGDYLAGRWQGRSHWVAYRHVGLEVEARRIASRFAAGAGTS